jgi:phosphoglycerol transferase MdoB-like AlkP superfamily enzyme
MNWAHVHLAVNHLPVILVPVGVALLAIAGIRRSQDLTTASLGLLVVTALIVGGVFLTGEPAEGVVERVAGISTDAIEAHEEAALVAAVVTALAGLLALAVLVAVRGEQQATTWMLIMTLGAGIAAAALLARAANLGAYIRHSEIADTGMDGLTPSQLTLLASGKRPGAHRPFVGGRPTVAARG